MSGYFEEMGWRPLEEGEQPDHLLHLARYLVDSGVFDGSSDRQWPMLPPPAAKEAIKALPDVTIEDPNKECPICLKLHEIGNVAKKMPCTHEFHANCILTWLNKTNSCPVCRYELPTDSEAYEAFRKEKKRVEQRKLDLEVLHDSMFS